MPHPIPPTPLLTVTDLAVSFAGSAGPRAPRVQAVDGVSLTIHPRQTLAVVGESGCGKSVTAMTTMRLLAMPPARVDRGSIILNDAGASLDLLNLPERGMQKVRGGKIAMIFQEPMTSLNPVYTVGEQIVEAVLLHQSVAREQAIDIACRAMTDVGITNARERMNAYPHQFSGGMRQRVMIAMALACEPSLLLADEPTTALDVTIQAQILDLLREIQRARGMGMMLITHALGVVAENADVVCVMYAGRVVEYATVFELFDHPLHPYTRGLLRSIPSMSHRRDRLTTVREITENPGEFGALERDFPGCVPWWPWHDPPKSLQRRTDPPRDYTLREIKPDHWVGLWRTEAAARDESRRPDLSFRIAGAAAIGAST